MKSVRQEINNYFSWLKTSKGVLITTGIVCFALVLVIMQLFIRSSGRERALQAVQEGETVVAVEEKVFEGYLDFKGDSLGIKDIESYGINGNTIIYISMRNENIKLPVGVNTLEEIVKHGQRVILKGIIAERKSSFSVWQYVIVRLKSEDEPSSREEAEELRKDVEAREKFLEREKELQLLPPDWYIYNNGQFRTSLLFSGEGKLAMAGKWKYYPKSSDSKEAFFRIESVSIFPDFYQGVDAWFASNAKITESESEKPLTLIQDFLCALNGEKVAALGEFKKVGEGEGEHLICTRLKIQLGIPCK